MNPIKNEQSFPIVEEDHNNAIEPHKRKREDKPEKISVELKRELPLFVASFILSKFPPHSIRNRQDFLKPLNDNIHQAFHSEEFHIWTKQCQNLIFLQSGDILAFAIVEIISNGLDAIRRAGREKGSLAIKLERERIRFTDNGDGMGWREAHTYLVPGLSSNQQAIFNHEKGKKNVTGRFGVGGSMAPWSLILYPYSPTRMPPVFCYQANMWILKETIFINKEEYQLVAQFEDLAEKPRVYLEKIDAKRRKGTISTSKESDNLKLKLYEKEGEPYVDIKELGERSDGTTVEIKSPILSELPIERIVRETFEYFPSEISIQFNEDLINASSGLLELGFAGGVLKYRHQNKASYQPFSDCKICCKLSICEGGRTIKQYRMIGYALAHDVAISFDSLFLSQDRKTLELSSPAFKEKVERVVEELVEQKWNPLTISQILNALHPLLSEPKLNLIPFVQDLLAAKKISGIPAIREFSLYADAQSWVLHPDFLPLSSLASVPYLSNKRAFLIRQPKPIHPIGMATIQNEACLFVDAAALHNRPAVFYLHFHLLDEFYKLRTKSHISKEALEHIEKFFLITPPPAEVSPLSQSDMPECQDSEMSVLVDMKNSLEALKKLKPTSQQEPFQSVLEKISQASNSLLSPSDSLITEWQFKCLLEWLSHNHELASNLPDDFWKFALTVLHHMRAQKNVQAFDLIHQCASYYSTLESQLRVFYVKFLNVNANALKYSAQKYVSFFTNLQGNFFFGMTQHFERLKNILSSAQYSQGEMGETYSNAFMEFFSLSGFYPQIELLDSILPKLSIPNRKLFLKIFFWFDLKELALLSEKKLEMLFDSLDFNYLDTYFIQNSFGFKLIEIKPDLPSFLNGRLLKEMISLIQAVDKMNRRSVLIQLLGLICLKKESCVELGNQEFIKHLTEFTKNQIDLSPEPFLNALLELHHFENEVLAELKTDLYGAIFAAPRFAPSILHASHDEITATLEEILEQNAEQGNEENHAVQGQEEDNEDLAYFRFQIELKTKNPPCDELKTVLFPHLLYYGRELLEARDKKEEDATQEHMAGYCLALLNFAEACQMIPYAVKKLLYIGLIGDFSLKQFEEFYTLQPMPTPSSFLHDYPPFQAVHGNPKLCQICIQKAITQNLDPDFYIVELLKNGMENGATEFYIWTKQAEQGDFVVSFSDNGTGMDEKEIDALVVISKSTKSNQNYGIGFYSCLKKSHKVRVVTSKGSGEVIHLDLEKSEGSLLFSRAKYEKSSSPGTQIILCQKPSANFTVEFMLFKASLQSVCRELKNLTVYFNDEKITGTTKASPLVVISKSYQDGLGSEENTTIQLTFEESGLYRKDLRIGPLEQKYLEKIPFDLLKQMEQEKLHFRFFFTQNQQIMNRAGSANEGDFQAFMQEVCYQAAQKYFLLKVLEGKTEKLLAYDIYQDFRFNLEDYVHKETKSPQFERKKALVEAIAQEFARLESVYEEVAFAIKPEIKKDAGKWSKWVLEAEERKERLPEENLKQFTTRCWPLPLMEGGLSLLDIRNDWKSQLARFGILNETGDYDEMRIEQLGRDRIKAILDEIEAIIKEKFSDAYAKTIHNFKQHIEQRIGGIFKCLDMPCKEADEDTLAFFKELINRMGGLKTEIEFFSSANGVEAYVLKGKIHINRRTNFDFVSDMKKTYVETGKNWEKVMQKHAVSLRHWISLLTHECTHILDGSDCLSDHGPWFEETNALFEGRSLSIGVIQILSQIFEANQVIPR